MSVRMIAAALCAGIAFTSTAAAETIFIRGATVHTASERGTLDDYDIIVSGGVIAELGRGLKAPADAMIVEAKGRPVTPGFMASYSYLGLVEISLDDESNDTKLDKELGLGAALDVQYAVNPASSLIPNARLDGVTRAVVAPRAGGSLFAGRAAVIDLSGGRRPVNVPRAALFAEAGAFGAEVLGGSRIAAWTVLREAFDDAVAYAARNGRKDDRKYDELVAVSDIEALVPVVKGQLPLALRVNRAADIRQALRLKTDYKALRLILFGGREAWMEAKALKNAGVPVVIDPSDNLPSNYESLAATLKNAARLNAAGVTFAISMVTSDVSHRAGQLGQLAGLAVANGLPWDAALAAITRVPAEIWGLKDRYGQVAEGYEADLVVWDGDPLEVTSNVDVLIIRGKMMPLRSRMTELRDRYSDLGGREPFAYR